MNNNISKLAKAYRIAAIIFYIAALCFFTTIILHYINGSKGSPAGALCLGGANLCLGAANMNLYKKELKTNKSDEK